MEEINKLENVAGSEGLKLTTLFYFSFEDKLIDKCFVPFTVMNEKTSDDEIKIALDSLKQGIKDEQPFLFRLKRVQHDYALKNHFAIAGDL